MVALKPAVYLEWCGVSYNRFRTILPYVFSFSCIVVEYFEIIISRFKARHKIKLIEIVSENHVKYFKFDLALVSVQFEFRHRRAKKSVHRCLTN